MEVLIKNRQDRIPVTPEMEKLLKKTVQVTVQQENPSLDPEVSILLVDDPAIQELNCEYRGIDRPTDVLSFAMEEETEDSPPFISFEEDNILGDIVISLETARRQAEEESKGTVLLLSCL